MTTHSPSSSRSRSSRLWMLFALMVIVNGACAVVVGIDDYEVCRDGECEAGTSSDDAAADTLLTDTNPIVNNEAGSDAPNAADADAQADAPPMIDATCNACPVGSPQKSCVDGGCSAARRVFLSSSASTAALAGVNGADARCQTLANAVGLGGSWQAWISTGASDPNMRFMKATVPYRLLDGTIIATSFADLVDGMIAHAINMDEHGIHITGAEEVWTGTKVSGNSGGNKDCASFTSGLVGADPVRIGLSDRTDGGWTEAYDQFCDRTNPRLYCFEQ